MRSKFGGEKGSEFNLKVVEIERVGIFKKK